MAFNYSTKDQELAERLEKEGYIVTKVKRDPEDGLKKYTFKETVNEINKFLKVKPEKKEKEKEGGKK